MKTHYFTFGQTHTHSFNGVTLDVVVKITAEDPRKKMFEYFGDKWGFEHKKLEDVGIEYYSKGIFNTNTGKFETPDKEL